MSEPDGDLLAMLQRARAVDQAAPESVPRRRRGQTNAVTTEPSEEDVPTMVRTDISVGELEVRAQLGAERSSAVDDPMLERITPEPGTTEPVTPSPPASAPASSGPESSDPTAPLGAPPRPTPATSRAPTPARWEFWIFLIVVIVCSLAVVLLLREGP